MREGIVTYGDREPVDAALAAKQHGAYVAALAAAGWMVQEVESADALPDSDEFPLAKMSGFLAIDEDLTFIRLLETHDQFEYRRLPGAAGAENDLRVSRQQRKADVTQDDLVIERK